MKDVKDQLSKKKPESAELGILSDPDPTFKYDQLLIKASLYDQKAQRKEQYYRFNVNNNKQEKIKNSDEVDAFYLKSIKAKLAILTDLQKESI